MSCCNKEENKHFFKRDLFRGGVHGHSGGRARPSFRTVYGNRGPNRVDHRQASQSCAFSLYTYGKSKGNKTTIGSKRKDLLLWRLIRKASPPKRNWSFEKMAIQYNRKPTPASNNTCLAVPHCRPDATVGVVSLWTVLRRCKGGPQGNHTQLRTGRDRCPSQKISRGRGTGDQSLSRPWSLRHEPLKQSACGKSRLHQGITLCAA